MDHLSIIILRNQDFKAGEVIFVEPSLLNSEEAKDNPAYIAISSIKKLDFELIWYWSALNTLFVEEEHLPPVPMAQCLNRIKRKNQSYFLMLFSPDTKEPSPAVLEILDVLNLTNYVDAMLFEQLLQVWIHNCFERSNDPLGFGVYFLSSFMVHSCHPNAAWHYSETQDFVLKARRDIKRGEELSITYLSEDAALQPAFCRRHTLQTTKSFWCECERCSAPLDLSRGFRCPSCLQGTIYVDPNAGASGTDSFLTVNNPNCREKLKLHQELSRSEGFIDRNAAYMRGVEWVNKGPDVCQTCNYGWSLMERNYLLEKERWMVKQLVQFSYSEDDVTDETPVFGPDVAEKLTHKNFGVLNNMIQGLFQDHWINVAWYKLYGEHPTEGLKTDGANAHYSAFVHRNALASRLKTIFRLFPDAGAVSWVLEELGNVCLRVSKVNLSKYARNRSDSSNCHEAVVPMSKRMARECWNANPSRDENGNVKNVSAFEFYRAANCRLTTLFGDEESVGSVQKQIGLLRSYLETAGHKDIIMDIGSNWREVEHEWTEENTVGLQLKSIELPHSWTVENGNLKELYQSFIDEQEQEEKREIMDVEMENLEGIHENKEDSSRNTNVPISSFHAE